MANFNAVKWHGDRHRQIVAAHPEVKELFGYDHMVMFWIVVLPLLDYASIYASKFLNIYGIILLAATVGVGLRMHAFNAMHELGHKLVHPMLNGKIKDVLLIYLHAPGIESMYPYHGWWHVTHHANMGQQSLQEAYDYAKDLDNSDSDVLIPTFYARKWLRSDEHVRHASWINKPWKRIVWFGFIDPIIHFVYVSSTQYTLVPVYLARLTYLWIKNGTDSLTPKLRWRILMGYLDLTYNTLTLLLVYYVCGWNGLLFILFTQVFWRGFAFHPILTFWLSNHMCNGKENGADADKQPTSSVYCPILGLFVTHQQYHVEHHDFLQIPARRLKKLRKIAPEFYNNLTHYPTIWSCYKEIFNPKKNLWHYSCQE